MCIRDSLATEDVEKELMGLHGFTISNFFAVIKPTQDALSAREYLLGHGGLTLTKGPGRTTSAGHDGGDASTTEPNGDGGPEEAAFSYDFGSVLYGVATDLAATLANLGEQMDKDGTKVPTGPTLKQQQHAHSKKKRTSAAVKHDTVSDVGMEVSEFQQMIELLAGRAQVTFDVDQGGMGEVCLLYTSPSPRDS
eukprot:TRINITY_DN57341_c0_g1_i2.p1 TRINITY_DN57341_c0_g1~~TRINITY_DN57341_c0_g1_i2.p1  ORF type:complete len:194 (-),score=41.22 TRINITY_DN57341_c0_g1_i2:90-671(-)